MAEFPALPLWTDAYLGDTAHLTNEEHGVYLRLLMFAWRSPDCALPDDDKRLAIMTGLTDKKWRAIRPVVAAFWTIGNGAWTQKRLTKERDFVRGKSEKNRDAAKARWNDKPLGNNNSPNADAMPAHMPEPCQTDAPTPIPMKKEERGKPLSRAPDGFDEFWHSVPRKVAKDKALPAYAKALRKTDARTLIEAMRRYAQSRIGEDPQYTAHPASWLNAGRWEDEPQLTGGPQGGNSKGERRIQSWLAGASIAPRVDCGPDTDAALPLLARR